MEDTRIFRNELARYLVIVGKNVKRLRLEKGLTQQQLGSLADETERGTISNIERCVCNNVSLGVLIKISVTLKVPLNELVKEEKE